MTTEAELALFLPTVACPGHVTGSGVGGNRTLDLSIQAQLRNQLGIPLPLKKIVLLNVFTGVDDMLPASSQVPFKADFELALIACLQQPNDSYQAQMIFCLPRLLN